MLVLSRKEDQSIVFPNLGISIEIVRVQGNKVCVGVEAPKAIRIVRGELQAGKAVESQDESSDFQLGQFIALLAPDARRELRNRLNFASESVHAAQNHIEQGGLDDAESFLSKAVEALDQLNKLFESPLQNDSTSNCIKENRLAYGLSSGRFFASAGDFASDRQSATWYPHQLLEYLQQQLCSSN